MKRSEFVNFKIDHLDPMGQGVYKEEDHIYFIPKTLPHEEGKAQIIRSKKKMHFCVPINLTKPAKKRVTPDCPHYNECSGCHFLHTNYESELEFKRLSFRRMLKEMGAPQIQTLEADRRLHYRNRVQLHKKNKLIGHHKPFSKEIIETPKCQIYLEDLTSLFKDVYKRKFTFKSHIELYKRGDSIQCSVDLPYSQGGFTQVNSAMNSKMKQKIQSLVSSESSISVLDLFAGDGNLSAQLNYHARVCMDSYKKDSVVKDKKNQVTEFINADLFSTKSLYKLRETSFDLLILDPPRSGHKDLLKWVKKFNPKEIIYVSCHPMTMVRDLKSLKSERDYTLLNTVLVDLFPSTFHFEAIMHLKLR